jgi:aminomethyltransferase
MVDFAGWDMPQHYTSVREEQQAVRQRAGLFDVSHMGRITVAGERAGDFLQRMVTNDVSAVAQGRAQYGLICNEQGGILDDLIVYHGETAWTVVWNAGNREKDLAWMVDHVDRDVRIADHSDDVALLALQGPAAEALLAPLVAADLTGMPYFGYAQAAVAGVEWGFVARTGYTGEDGFELFVRASDAAAVWDALLGAGAQPCGLATRDVCRLEAGLRLYGTDMDESTNPYEAGLGWTVKLDKGDFVGRDALARIREAGPTRKLAGLRGRDRLIPRHGAQVRRQDGPVGAVTGGTHSFWLGAGIGMAMVTPLAAQPGQVLEVETRGGFGEATVERLPFYRGSVRTPSPGQKT